MFVRPVIRMDQQGVERSHVAAFEFFGGVPARLVPDNLKTGVDRPDLYDPKINRAYAELAAHYGCLVDPARATEPRGQTSGCILHLFGAVRGQFSVRAGQRCRAGGRSWGGWAG